MQFLTILRIVSHTHTYTDVRTVHRQLDALLVNSPIYLQNRQFVWTVAIKQTQLVFGYKSTLPVRELYHEDEKQTGRGAARIFQNAQQS